MIRMTRHKTVSRAVVIDLGKPQTVTAVQYLPRMESGAPGSIRDFKIYVSDKPFKM